MAATDTKEKELEALYEEIREKQDRLNELLRDRGPEDVKGDYVFETPEGDVTLSQLFGDRAELILVHNMGKQCAYCTLWADGFNGVVHHLENRAAFVVVSPNTPAEQQAFAASRGWRFRMVSAANTTFTADMGYLAEYEGKPWPMPGVSTFRKKKDGSIQRIAHTPFGPGDPYCGVFHLFALLGDAVGPDWQPKLSYA